MEWPKRLVRPTLPEATAEEELDLSPKTMEEFDSRIAALEASIASFKQRVEAHTEHGEDLFDAAMAEQVLAMGGEVDRLKAEREEFLGAPEAERLAA